MRSQAMTRVLLFDDRVLDGNLHEDLSHSGLHVVDTPDLETGVQLLRDSDEAMTALLGTLLLDKSLAERHAYILVTPTPIEVGAILGNLLNSLHVTTLTAPLDREKLLSAMWLATQRSKARIATAMHGPTPVSLRSGSAQHA
jgi:hypothetical protein